MKRYSAKYFDGESPQSLAVEISIKNAVLEIVQNQEIIDHWPIKLLRFDPAHISTTMLMCEGETDARLEITDRGVIQELQSLGLLKKETSINLDYKQLFIWLTVIIIAFGGAVISVKPLTRFIAKGISHQTEHAMLEKAQAYSHIEFCQLTSEQQQSLDKLVAKVYPLMDGDNELGLRVKVAKSSQENAFAVPGAEIWILEGLLKKAKTPEEVVGVLAHEIEHVRKRHVLESIVRSSLLTSLLAISVGDASAVLVVDPHTASKIFSLSYDRQMENEADTGALERLKKAKVSSQGLVDFFERNKGTGSSIPQFLSTHPSDESRIAFLKSLAQPTQGKLLSDKEWAELKSCL